MKTSSVLPPEQYPSAGSYGNAMIAVIEHNPAGPALLVHGVRVAEKPVGDTTLQALADQINAAAGWRAIETAPRNGTTFFIHRRTKIACR